MNIKGDSIMVQSLPKIVEKNNDVTAEQDIEWLQTIILAVRNIRGEMNIAPGKAIPALFRNTTENDKNRLKQHQHLLQSLVKLESITLILTEDKAPMSATGLAGNMEILIPMAGLIDKAAELSRLHKEMTKIEDDIKRTSGKLSNQGFVAKAPAEVVDKEKQKLEELSDALTKLKVQHQQMTEL